MTGSVPMAAAGSVVADLAAAINANRAWLSEIDGAIGDGDHGINMSKGFSQAAAALGTPPPDLSRGCAILGETLLSGIGGSMGPLYGSFFLEVSGVLDGQPILDAPLFGRALRAGLASIEDLGAAKLGDKTLLDTLIPALAAFEAAAGQGFAPALAAMAAAAERGRDSTVDMVAKIGRAARLGERSRGTLDAGAASCCLILQTMAASITAKLD